MDYFISPFQGSFIPGRRSIDNVGILREILDSLKKIKKGKSTSIILNGNKLDSMVPAKGLRQVDPISPYLFILCMDYLNFPIEEETKKGTWSPLKLERGSIALSHLLFADDLILLCSATIQNCSIMRKT